MNDSLERFLHKEEKEPFRTVDAAGNIIVEYKNQDILEYRAALGEILKEYMNMFSVPRLFRGRKWREKEERIRNILNSHQILTWHERSGKLL